jgi:hypothetical protein
MVMVKFGFDRSSKLTNPPDLSTARGFETGASFGGGANPSRPAESKASPRERAERTIFLDSRKFARSDLFL